jgi:hypothetical protein
MITSVTITGADDGVTPQDITNFSFDFPYVEWGILFSKKRQGSPRYPSLEWVKQLVEIKKLFPGIKISAHLCGEYVRELLTGNFNFAFKELVGILHYFDRIQINTGGAKQMIFLPEFIAALDLFPGKQYIFQMCGNSDIENAMNVAYSQGQLKVAALFDKSGGKGLSPLTWPAPLDGIICGYAGGLNPENIHTACISISMTTEHAACWIDMESGVRSDDDKFDLNNVDKCLTIAKPFILKVNDKRNQ